MSGRTALAREAANSRYRYRRMKTGAEGDRSRRNFGREYGAGGPSQHRAGVQRCSAPMRRNWGSVIPILV